MAYFKTCMKCGCSLDPGERCDCEEEKKKQEVYMEKHMKVDRKTKQLTFVWESEVSGYANKAIS